MRLPQMDASARGVGDGVGGGARGVARDEGAGAGAAGRVARRVLSVQHCVRSRRERTGEGVPPARGQAGVAAWGGNTAGATARWVRRTWERAAGRRSYLCACGGRGGVGRERTQVAKKSRPGPLVCRAKRIPTRNAALPSSPGRTSVGCWRSPGAPSGFCCLAFAICWRPSHRTLCPPTSIVPVADSRSSPPLPSFLYALSPCAAVVWHTVVRKRSQQPSSRLVTREHTDGTRSKGI